MPPMNFLNNLVAGEVSWPNLGGKQSPVRITGMRDHRHLSLNPGGGGGGGGYRHGVPQYLFNLVHTAHRSGTHPFQIARYAASLFARLVMANTQASTSRSGPTTPACATRSLPCLWLGRVDQPFYAFAGFTVARVELPTIYD